MILPTHLNNAVLSGEGGTTIVYVTESATELLIASSDNELIIDRNERELIIYDD